MYKTVTEQWKKEIAENCKSLLCSCWCCWILTFSGIVEKEKHKKDSLVPSCCGILTPTSLFNSQWASGNLQGARARGSRCVNPPWWHINRGLVLYDLPFGKDSILLHRHTPLAFSVDTTDLISFVSLPLKFYLRCLFREASQWDLRRRFVYHHEIQSGE